MDIRLSQTRETEAHLVRRASFAYRYAYARSTESRLAGDPGQDYLALREDNTCLVFALCDGVGQSFFGDLAARQVGDALVDWLWQRSLAGDDEHSLRLALTRRLSSLAADVAAQVATISLPDDLSPLVREVLERKRSAGSHTTLVAGRVDLTANRVALVWLGDSPIRLWQKNGGERTAELGDTFHTESRWSSQAGVVGALNVFLTPLHQVSRIVAYSDGLSSVADVLTASPASRQLDAVISDLAGAPTSDDISLIEIWLGPMPKEEDWARLPAPDHVDVAYRDGRLAVNWSPVPNARHYQVEVGNGGARRWQADRPPHTLEIEHSKAVGAVARVRAWDDNGPGDWSPAVPLLVELPVRPTVAVDASPTVSAEPAAPVAGGRRGWLWVVAPVAMVVVLVCLVGAVLALRRGVGRQRLLTPATLPVNALPSPVVSVDPPATVPVTKAPAAVPSPTAAPTTTPWLTWTPGPSPSPAATVLPTDTVTPTPTPTMTAVPPTPTMTTTVALSPTMEIPSPSPTSPLTPTVETQVPLVTPSPGQGDLAPKPEGGTLGSGSVGLGEDAAQSS